MLGILERIEPIKHAFARLQKAPLEAAGNEHIVVYENATLRLADFRPQELNVTSLYILKPHLASLRKLRAWLLNQYQIDIFQQSDILHMRLTDGTVTVLAPPFVEIYEETVSIVPRPGDRLPPLTATLQIPILKDGIHRAYLAQEENALLRCIVAHGALKDHPPYAYPNEWTHVKIYDTKPEEKKFYRRQDPYTRMRPLRALCQSSEHQPQTEYGR